MFNEDEYKGKPDLVQCSVRCRLKLFEKAVVLNSVAACLFVELELRQCIVPG
jgi:hypothetical protein